MARQAGLWLALAVVALTCIAKAGAAASTQQQQVPLGRRALLQAGPASVMNEPVLDDTQLERSPAARSAGATIKAPAPKLRSTPATSAAAASKAGSNTTAAATAPTKQQAAGLKQQQPQQQGRALLATNHRKHHSHNRQWRHQQRWRKYGRYDRAALAPYVAPANAGYGGLNRQPLPVLSALLGSLGLQPGSINPRSTASSLAQAYGSGRSEAAAQAVASAMAGDSASSAQATSMAQAVTETAASSPSVASGLLAKSASLAVTRGRTDQFANNLAQSFGYAKQRSVVPQLTSAVCDSINQGGDPARLAAGTAIGKAIAGGGDSQAAVAEATATAMCQGGSTAQAWAAAYAIALSKDANGCLVLNEAKAQAQAKCGDGAADAVSNAEATSNILGFCGLLDGLPDMDMSVSAGKSGSSASHGGWGEGTAGGWAGGNGWKGGRK